MCIIYLLCGLVMVYADAAKENLKDEYCTDPRTMRKHAAYTEWADAYSCTRHRCQPGGRNLAIYTVGCKRVEAPESAIECEEVVEDTNMQFPYCCTRLRCLVVVRGEVWTRVLGQPWETLPAAPWSHMYKMKKPPPVDGGFLPKSGPAAGPVYELAEDSSVDRRAAMEKDKPMLRAAPPPSVPDIVIALTTNEKKPNEAEIKSKLLTRADDDRDQPNEIEAEEAPLMTEKVPEIMSEERMYASDKKTSRDRKFTDTSDDEPNYKGLKESRSHKADTVSDERFFPKADKNARVSTTWAQIPQKQWSSPNTRAQSRPDTHVEPFQGDSDEKQDKPASLQHLVNAIGTRMRDIENVVQQMSEKVQPPSDSGERMRAERTMLHPKVKESEPVGKGKQPNIDNYNRFPSKQGGSKYLHGAGDATSEVPLFVGDTMNGYFSDASNNLLRRSMANHNPKEPHGTYMVPISNDHKKTGPDSGEPELKHKKHTHKKKKSKHGRRKHHREDREKKLRVPEEKNAVSIEDSNDFGTGTSQEIQVTSLRPELQESIFVRQQPMSYRPTTRRPILPIAHRPFNYRPIAHRSHNRPNMPRRIHLKLDTANRNPIINYMRNYGSNRDKYRTL